MKIHLIYAVVIASMGACQSHTDKEQAPEEEYHSPQEMREMSINRNREMLRLEREAIQSYIDTSVLNWRTTGTGLNFSIFDSTGREHLKDNDIIDISYQITLLNGMEVYSSAVDGQKTFRVGRDNDAVLGLHEGVRYLAVGDSAVLLIPSHLGWGVGGDNRDIPPGYPILYYLRILNKH